MPTQVKSERQTRAPIDGKWFDPVLQFALGDLQRNPVKTLPNLLDIILGRNADREAFLLLRSHRLLHEYTLRF